MKRPVLLTGCAGGRRFRLAQITNSMYTSGQFALTATIHALCRRPIGRGLFLSIDDRAARASLAKCTAENDLSIPLVSGIRAIETEF